MGHLRPQYRDRRSEAEGELRPALLLLARRRGHRRDAARRHQRRQAGVDVDEECAADPAGPGRALPLQLGPDRAVRRLQVVGRGVSGDGAALRQGLDPWAVVAAASRDRPHQGGVARPQGARRGRPGAGAGPGAICGVVDGRRRLCAGRRRPELEAAVRRLQGQDGPAAGPAAWPRHRGAARPGQRHGRRRSRPASALRRGVRPRHGARDHRRPGLLAGRHAPGRQAAG